MAITYLIHATNLATGIAKESASLTKQKSATNDEINAPVDSFVSSREIQDEQITLSDKLRKLSYSNRRESNNPGTIVNALTFGKVGGEGKSSGATLIYSGAKDLRNAAAIASIDGPLPVGDLPAGVLATRGVIKITVGAYQTMTSPVSAPATERTPQKLAADHLEMPGLSKNQKRHWKTVRDHSCKKDDSVYTRFGRDWEDTEHLGKQARMAEKSAIGITGRTGLHGVSVTARNTGRPTDSVGIGSVVREHFPVEYTPTARDPLHHSLILPKPVTTTTELLFNGIFGRTP